ncbi:MAG TPA: cyclic nucleotide-binding domain-containing protein [Promineifilum sp.]|nr:cyclic nucleotide-binding domain-containing protein [Promineifilum sp.]HRO90000.1 cyclic nucleotide-binding domain-containing protein [Promineifilum sp.]HRQ14289.1 cyclic nucleotide-binding domain-containing protein [Promineifilum sp.]
MTDKREFLAELPIFADLSTAALDAVARITREYAFKDNAIIAYQRDLANRLYIVKEGRLFARAIDDNGIVRETYSFLPGQYFNENWLFIPGIHSATIKGKGREGGRLYIIEGPEFMQLLKHFPAIIDELAPREDDDVHYGLSDEAWGEAQKLKVQPRRMYSSVAKAMLQNEHIELFTRRSWWFLLGQLIPPTLIMLFAAVLLVMIPADSPLERALKIGLPVLTLLIGMIFFLLRLIDFRTDYFIITNKHVTHHEFELRHFRIHLVKVPIGQIQTVEIMKPSFWATLFDIGTARVTTAAVAGVILFDNIDDPTAVKNTLERLSGQYKTVESAQTQAVMRQSIENHFGLDPQLATTDAPVETPLRPVQRRGFFDNLGKQFGWRVVEGQTITYRKSLFVLAKQVALPVLGFVILISLGMVGIYLKLPSWMLGAVIGIIGFFNLLWFAWQAENWRNDIFQLTDRFVLDVDRKPFGFGESRKQAAISNIQNVDASRPGLLPTLFNYGFVSIDTAGAKSDIVFDYVPNPELIQSDIFARIDETRRRDRVQEGSSRRKEYALLLDVYRQAMEQQRIPQRTPTDIPEDLE